MYECAQFFAVDRHLGVVFRSLIVTVPDRAPADS